MNNPTVDARVAARNSNLTKQSKTAGLLIHLGNRKLPDSVGKKAENLWLLKKRGFLVPDTYVLTWDAYLSFVNGKTEILSQLQTEMQNLLDPEKKYAVRSSADVEDSQQYSYAGQFTSLLDVKGIDQLLNAIIEVWKETRTERLQAYAQKSQKDFSTLRMAVLIQEMVEPVVSGVTFSINPTTSLDEIVVEAINGRGDLLVQEGITPFRWIMKWGKWIEKPGTSELPVNIIEEVVKQTKNIVKSMKREVDLEWVFDGKEIYWVQMRDITAIIKADIYSNKISKEMTPGMAKPLDWSVAAPIPSAVWLDFITQLIGKNDFTPDKLIKSFHYRTYHNFGVFGQIFQILGMPRESLEIMMGVASPGAGKPNFKPGPKFLRLIPRVLRFLWDKWVYAKKAKTDFNILQSEARQYPLHPADEDDEKSLLKVINSLVVLNTRTTYHTILTNLMMQVYNKVFRSQIKKFGYDLEDIDFTEGLSERKEYDPNVKLAELNDAFLNLSKENQNEILQSDFKNFLRLEGIKEFQGGVLEFLDAFGHMSDRTVFFDNIPWRETPDLILKLITTFEKPKERTTNKIPFRNLELKGFNKILTKTFYHRARQFLLFREKYSSLYTYTLMLFRVYYLAIADRLVDRRLLDSSEDIYYLYDAEIREFIAGEIDGKGFKELVEQRKQEMKACEHAILPQVIFGNEPPPVILKSEMMLHGVPTSRGYYTGRIKVVRGLNDFSSVEQGEVLAIPYSDVGWAPLFAKAGAIIAESGGILSHSSIVAREYNIPAVVSVEGATRLVDGTVVTVDGHKGEIYIHQ